MFRIAEINLTILWCSNQLCQQLIAGFYKDVLYIVSPRKDYQTLVDKDNRRTFIDGIQALFKRNSNQSTIATPMMASVITRSINSASEP